MSSNPQIVELKDYASVLHAHFPGFPVLPGSSIVQLCEDLAAETLPAGSRIRTISSAKFLAPIQPEENPRIAVSLQAEGSHAQALVSSMDGKPLAKVQFIIATA